MLETQEGLNGFNQNLNNYLFTPINERVGKEKGNITNQIQKLTEIKDVKFSYPKNGLYGLL